MRWSMVIVPAIIVGLTVFGWYTFVRSPSPAAQAYQKFATAILHGQYDIASDMATGQARQYVEAQTVRLPIGGRISQAQMTTEIAGDIEGIKFNLFDQQEKTTANGEKNTHLSAMVTVRRRHATDRVVGGGSAVTYRQTATVQSVGNQLKISDFTSVPATE